MLRDIRFLLATMMPAVAAAAAGQGTTGSVSGCITDDTGGALPGATVTVREVDTDQKRPRHRRRRPVPRAAARAGQVRRDRGAPGLRQWQFGVKVDL